MINEDVKGLQQFLKEGNNPNLPDSAGERALHYAVQNNNSAIVSVLLLAKANPNAGNKKGITPFMYALGGLSPDIAAIMYLSGGKMDAITQDGRSSWHFVKYGTETATVVKDLLSYTDDGWTEQRWFYEEDNLQRQWQQEEVDNARRQQETAIRLAESKKREAQLRLERTQQEAIEAERKQKQALADQQQFTALFGTVVGAATDIYSASTAADAAVDAARIAKQATEQAAKLAAQTAQRNAEAARKQAALQQQQAQRQAAEAASNAAGVAQQQAQQEAQRTAQQLAQQQAQQEAQQLAQQQAAAETQRKAAEEAQRKAAEDSAALASCVHMQDVYEGRIFNFGSSLQDVKGPALVMLNKCGRAVNVQYCIGSSSCSLSSGSGTHLNANDGVLLKSGDTGGGRSIACIAPHRPRLVSGLSYTCER